MKNEALEFLENLGPLYSYQTPENLGCAWKRMIEIMDELKVEFAKLESDHERTVYALDVMNKMIDIARSRACKCEVDNGKPLACENIDIFQMNQEWLEFVRDSFVRPADEQSNEEAETEPPA